MPIIALLLTAAALPVRAEPVGAREPGAAPATRPSTSSGRTAEREDTPIDAERAFAADAKTIGQWTAFRKWSTDDAVMFTPQPVNAHEFLKVRKDPPKAIDWRPTASYVSCDGTLAINTGGYVRPDGKAGYFSTVWQREPDGGWKWIVDGGGDLKVVRPRSAAPKVIHASCGQKGTVGTVTEVVATAGPPKPGYKSAIGGAQDDTLTWLWIVKADGSRRFMASYWDGRRMVGALDDRIPAPPK